jgi:acetolactate synthase-1/2/3 large subunit
MNGGEVLVEVMLSRGVDTVFFVPGGTNTTVMECLSRHQNKIRAVPTRLESSAAFACDTYAKFAKKPACMLASRAPGACNAAIGIHNAQQASRPLVFFISDIPKEQQGREAFQELNYHLMYKPIAKAVFDVYSFEELPGVAARALDLAVSGRPGPVVVAVSKDILDGPEGEPPIPDRPAPVKMGADASAIDAAVKLIDAAKHPILISGEMVSAESAFQDLIDFVEASGVGVLTAYRQQDTFPSDHAANFGHLGINRLPFQEAALKDCDLLISMGARMDSITVNDYSMIRPEQKLVMVYPDASEFSQWQADAAIGANVTPALKALTAKIGKPSKERLAWRDKIHGEEVEFAKPGEIEIQGDVDMARVIEHFINTVPKDCINISDAGTFGRWITRYYRFNQPDIESSPVSGCMGYGVPGGLGAQVAKPDSMVFVWVGDGGFTMTGHECAAIMQAKLPVKVIVCDNSAWGSILTHQQKRFGPDFNFGTMLDSPDFTTLGEGYGMASFRVTRTDEFPDALAGAMAHNGAALIHLVLDSRDVSPFSGSAR